MKKWFTPSLRRYLTLSHTLTVLTLALGMGAVAMGVVWSRARTLQEGILSQAESLAAEKVLEHIRRLEAARDGLARELAFRPSFSGSTEDLLFLHRVLSYTDIDRLEVFNSRRLLAQAYNLETGGAAELATPWFPQNPQVAALLLAGRPVTWLHKPQRGMASLKSAVKVREATEEESIFLVATLAVTPSWLAGALPSTTVGFLRVGGSILGSWPPLLTEEQPFTLVKGLNTSRVVARLNDDSSLEVVVASGKGAMASLLWPMIRGGILITLASLVLAFLLGETLARRILAPLHDLLEGTAAMARGHLSVRLPIRRKDELGALAREFNRMADELRTTYLGVIATLAEVVEAKSAYTREHIERVERLTMATANILEKRGWTKWSSHQKFILSVAAILHDVGKISIGNDILNKAGPLTTGERSEILSHPEVGAKIVERMGKLDRAAEIIRACHEHYDGSGYPRGLKGQEIPLEARIILAVDAFDAMTQVRPYSKARPWEEAVAELRAQAGKQFDPVVVEALIEAASRELRGEGAATTSSGFYQVLTESDEKAPTAS
ncbi:MAG: HD domain-containing phosphohydrolase [Thermoanaerobaculaceae bacterium]